MISVNRIKSAKAHKRTLNVNPLHSPSPQTKVQVETVIRLLGAGALLAATVIFPTLPIALKPILDMKRALEQEHRQREWARFNPWLLKQTLKRLHQQKIVKVVDTENGPVVQLTKKGQTKYLKFQLEDMMVKTPPRWDGKWRMIIYDIGLNKKKSQEIFRGVLKRLKFYQLQKSVYLTPFPCKEEIEFLRQYYEIGEDVFYCVAEQIENDEAFRKYFNV